MRRLCFHRSSCERLSMMSKGFDPRNDTIPCRVFDLREFGGDSAQLRLNGSNFRLCGSDLFVCSVEVSLKFFSDGSHDYDPLIGLKPIATYLRFGSLNSLYPKNTMKHLLLQYHHFAR